MSGKKRSEVSSVLKSAEKIRKDIFDARLREIDKITDKFNEIKDKSSNIVIEEELYQIDSIKKELNILNSSVIELQDKLSNISPKRRDYFDNEFNEASSYLKRYQEINNSLKNIYNEIEKKIDKMLDENKDAKTEVMVKYNLVKSLINDTPYTNPLDPDQKLNIKDLVIDVLKEPMIYEPIDRLMNIIENSIGEEKFISAKNDVNKLIRLITDVKDVAEDKLIELKENIEITMAIEDVLRSMCYEYETEFIDGDPNKGILIKTINSDDISVFLKGNSIEKEGEKDIDLIINDHFPNCKITADELAGRLKQMGICFEVKDFNLKDDIKKEFVSLSEKTKKEGN